MPGPLSVLPPWDQRHNRRASRIVTWRADSRMARSRPTRRTTRRRRKEQAIPDGRGSGVGAGERQTRFQSPGYPATVGTRGNKSRDAAHKRAPPPPPPPRRSSSTHLSLVPRYSTPPGRAPAYSLPLRLHVHCAHTCARAHTCAHASTKPTFVPAACCDSGAQDAGRTLFYRAPKQCTRSTIPAPAASHPPPPPPPPARARHSTL
ncbi:hypothetical protein CC85DRAFT_62607 [Cutaneotrichosporon oleaginosum]|uniref:Uncharacterized protein n=1 Tax=Cutaneotrichosporon oleaginosum TaxID=879819 RepID=A0A0J0XQE1_9TREE|nr:uncharacterized protein CC85DRAFT_62607 [Cutaneotrichosporon oleaginosum]KLT43341.1 hypothetical protein CC85DRAFT_62607 [Cutaneotrichosporon oleaginosum]TXT14397.1 hypothetical protein COLE_00590 [Cutaneotrichosporon oleaginosum]